MKTDGRASRGGAQKGQETLPAEESSPAERPSVADYALLEELRFVRREAQAEANLAYEDWRAVPCGERYGVYRAAQDRADAAQDRLADWATEINRELTDGPLALEALT